jgi:very-short-patch-repair endonuclease
MMAATLACGRGAVVSHLTAAHLLQLRDRLPVTIDVIASRGSGREIDGIRSHRVPRPGPGETGHCHRIPCTSPARTIVDLAGILGERSLRHLVERAAVLGVLDAGAVERLLAGRRRRGAPMLREILRPWRTTDPDESTTGVASTKSRATAAPHLRSELEARLLTLILASDLPRPSCNQRIALGDEGLTIEVDFLWPQQRVIVETDGRAAHDNPLAFERDRKRDRELQLSGYQVVRFTHHQVEQEPEAVIAAIRRLLVASTASPPHRA